ncbi:MAG: phage portal protein, partial [Anaerolineae bacterium]|nr:phage portal protein [Anaerolineae bacterium]
GLSSFAIIPAQNVVTSDTIFAIDDYDDFASLVEELQVRLEKIAHVLDKHADPSLSGPTSALTYDEETGEWFLKMGDYYHRNSKEDPAVEYVTWDGKLESSFQEIELLLDLIAVLSEMGSAIFDRDSLKGSGLSGRALRLLYVNPLTKVRRIRNRFDRSFKEAIALCSEVGYEGKSVEKKDISIKWNDGLPNDKKEDAEIGVIRTGGKATDTIVAQIMEQDGLTKEDAEAKYAEIVKETNARLLSEEPEPNFFEDEEDEGEGEEI